MASLFPVKIAPINAFKRGFFLGSMMPDMEFLCTTPREETS
jgi:hypothetical protein